MAKGKPNAVTVAITGAAATSGAGAVTPGIAVMVDGAGGTTPNLVAAQLEALRSLYPPRRTRAQAAAHARHHRRPKMTPEQRVGLIEVIRALCASMRDRPSKGDKGLKDFRDMIKHELKARGLPTPGLNDLRGAITEALGPRVKG